MAQPKKTDPTKEPTEEPEAAAAPLARVGNPILAPLREIIATIPSATDDPTARMMAAIANSPDAASWEDLFSADHFKDSAGKRVRIHTFRVNDSQYEGKLGVYFLCDYTDLTTGEEGIMTVGSEMAMAQLANCWKRGDLPHDFEIVRKDRPTKAGFYPMRLRSLGKVVTGDPAEVIEGEARAL